MAVVYLGLGSNLGDREANIRVAVSQLERNNIMVLKLSGIIETDPVGGPPQDKFLNAAVKVVTELSPQDLLERLRAIEKDLGRVRTVVNGPRPIDIDILLYNNDRVNTPNLTIPHPRMLERDFVMIPLKEIAPELVEELTHADSK